MVIVPAPLTNVHVPVPIVAVFPANVAVVPQTVWFGPALAVVVGPAGCVIVIVAVPGQPLLSKTFKVYVPAGSPVKLCVPGTFVNVATVVAPFIKV